MIHASPRTSPSFSRPTNGDDTRAYIGFRNGLNIPFDAAWAADDGSMRELVFGKSVSSHWIIDCVLKCIKKEVFKPPLEIQRASARLRSSILTAAASHSRDYVYEADDERDGRCSSRVIIAQQPRTAWLPGTKRDSAIIAASSGKYHECRSSILYSRRVSGHLAVRTPYPSPPCFFASSFFYRRPP